MTDLGDYQRNVEEPWRRKVLGSLAEANRERDELQARIDSAVDLLQTWTPPEIAPDKWTRAAFAVIDRLSPAPRQTGDK